MNDNWAIFLVGLLLGAIGCGSIVYEFERVKYLSLENNYQEAFTQAQSKVISQDKSSNAVNSNIGANYAKSVSDAISQYNAVSMPKANPSSMSVISNCPQPTIDASRKCAVNLQLCEIKVNDWQKWYHEQSVIYK